MLYLHCILPVPFTSYLQSLANTVLELKTYKQKFEAESRAHQESVARYQDDKKRVMNNEDANKNSVKGSK